MRVLVRSGSDRRNLEGLDVEQVVGNLRDPASLPPVLVGCDGLFLVAANCRFYVPDRVAPYATNVAGARALVRGRDKPLPVSTEAIEEI